MQVQWVGRVALRALCAVVMLAAAASAGCVVASGGDHGQPAGGGGTAPQPGTPTAAGCVAGARQDCSLSTTHGGITDCVVASQICHDDTWGACGDATPFCKTDAVDGMVTLVLASTDDSTFAHAWNADPGALQVHVAGLIDEGHERFALGGIGSGSAAIAADGAPPLEMPLAVDRRALVLEGETTIGGSFLRVKSTKLQLQIPVQTLHVTVRVDDGCALGGVDVALFVDASTTTAEERAMLGDPTDSNGSALGWWLTFTGTPEAHGH
jgi:hypothetical protein